MGRNPTSRRVEQYWGQLVGRGGGGLGYEQFKTIMRKERPTSRDDLMRAFARLDRNGDGCITADELMRAVTKVCVHVCMARRAASCYAVQNAVILCVVCSAVSRDMRWSETVSCHCREVSACQRMK